MPAGRRDLFDIPADVAYLNTAYIGPLPKTAVEAGRTAAERKARPWTMPPSLFFEETDVARAQAAKVMNADVDGIALVPACSYGLATAARNIPLEPGQEILILAEQFPSNVYTWRAMARRTGATVRTLSRPQGESWTQGLIDAIGPQTGLVACGHVHWIDGGIIDLEAVGAKARQHGAALAIDLTQSLGALPFDAKKVQPDFAVAAAYKWLLGPYSIGFLYVSPRFRDGEPLEENWINHAKSEDFTKLVDYQDGYQPGARRFDMGERANFAVMPPLIAAMELILDIGPETIAKELAATNAELVARLKPLGLTADPETLRSPHYLSLMLPDAAPSDLVQRLLAADVHVSRRAARLRVTPHLHVTTHDLERVERAVAEALK